MIALQLLMVRTCVITIAAKKKDSYNTKNWALSNFWNWEDFSMYLQFIFSLVLALFMLTSVFRASSLYFEILGFLALGVEALLGVPQYYKNFKRQSTDGLSISMVVGWTIGDSLKTVYFILRAVPAQFLLCGGLQICVDLAILAQFASYTPKSRDYLPY
mmetsp:Transcript_28062/g.50266  ORF Transcript_28062/g.50266 Transcript_28062/m.50266 type:complete len:159 (-) Transcript_28062:8-484(-)